MIKEKLRIFIVFVFFLLPVISCKDNADDIIPYVEVDFTLNINSTFYNELSSVGGWVYITGGYKGIIIYRFTIDEFFAYDRCCSYQPLVACERVEMEESGLGMIDSCCGSRFLILDGSVVNGPATRMLRQYRTSYDGVYLRVFN